MRHLSFVRTALVLLLPLSAAQATNLTLPATESYTLENGATVILAQKNDLPLIAARVAIRGGSLVDSEGKEGTSSLLSALLTKGAGQRNATQFTDDIANAGGELSINSGLESLWASADFLSEDASLMLELLADALQRPSLDAEEFVKIQTRAVQSLTAEKDGDPRGLVTSYGEAWLFQNHPYGRPSGGDENSLQAIALDDLKQYFNDHVGADRAIISLVGDFEPKAMKKAIELHFGSWKKAKGQLPIVADAKKQVGPRVLLVDKPGATQSYFWIGNVGTRCDNPSKDAQDLVTTIFGGRFTSMLNTELRVKSGLTYGARAATICRNAAGYASYNSFTRTDATEQAIDLALVVQDRLHNQTVDSDQLESARRYVIGQFAPRYETNSQLAQAFTHLALQGKTRDDIEGYATRINAVTSEAFSSARSVYPTEKNYAMVVIGDAEKIETIMAKYGPVTRISITAPGFSPTTP